MPPSKHGNRKRKDKKPVGGMFDPEHIGNLPCQRKTGLERTLVALIRLTPASKLDFI